MSAKRGLEDSTTPSAKKLKSDAFSPLDATPKALTGDALIAQKRAEIAAKLAAMTGKKAPAATGPVTANPSNSGHFSKEGAADLQRRIEEAKRKVDAARLKNAVKDNPYLLAASTSTAAPAPPPPGASGLHMTAHPLLLDATPSAPQSKKDRYKPMLPKFATIKANARNVPTPPPVSVAPIEVNLNPYATGTGKDFEGPEPKERAGRQLRFNQKGKYKALGEQLRKDAQLEELKNRIAESARKAGLDTEFETAEKNVRRGPPPDSEWWDASLLPGKAYDEFSLSNAYIRTSDSPISIYIQHPIPIPAPGDKDKAVLKPLKLTSKEAKKLRKGRRQAELQDKRDHIRMGLLPPDPPKVRLANLMRVLTSDAVQDPTRVEARVRREVALRKHTHDKMNAERKLDADERREKKEEKKAAEENKGLIGAVFRVKTLSDPAHRFKVRKNAEQLSLTGLCIFNPSFSVVYVEGAVKLVRKYKRLMLHRMNWTEAARPKGTEDVELDEDGGDAARPAEDSAERNVEDAPSLEDNRCDLIWEGTILERAFRDFKPRSCPTDNSARDALGPKLASRWDSAKNWKPEDEELY